MEVWPIDSMSQWVHSNAELVKHMFAIPRHTRCLSISTAPELAFDDGWMHGGHIAGIRVPIPVIRALGAFHELMV